MIRSSQLMGLAAALALAACHAPPPRQTEAQQARSVTVVTVAPRAITGALAASGDLMPREEAAVMPEVMGYRAARVFADVGDYVRRGQPLIQLDGDLLEAQIAQARAQAAQAQDQANRVKGLEGQGVLSDEQIASRRFQAQAAQASLRQLLTQQRKLTVTAPVSGVILERNVRPGDLSSAAGAAPWFRMARDGQMELRAELAEDDLARIRPGQSATVTLPSGAVVQGNVRVVSPQVDPRTKLGEVRILLPARADIRAGGFARAVFAEVSGLALAAPETAIRYDADGASVMVVQPDNRVKRMAVSTGARGGGWVQLVRGPPAGTRVVQNAAAFLLDGDLVRPTTASAAAAPPAVPAAKAAGASR
jgi:HlyD family secretion protein